MEQPERKGEDADDRSDAPSPEAGGGTGARPTDARDVDEAIDTLGGETDVTAG